MERLFRHPKLIIAGIAVITLFFAAQLPRIEMDNNNFRFVPANDEALLTSAYISDTFGSSLFILVGLERAYGDIFDPDFLRLVRDYVNRIEELDVVGNVNSIVSSEYITGDSDSIIVEPLVSEDFTGTAAEIAELKKRLLSWDMYQRALISDDFSATQIIVPMTVHADEASKPEVIASFIQIRDLARELFSGSAQVYVTGLPVITATISEAMKADLALLIPLVIFVVLLIVFLPLRRMSFVLLSILAVIVAVIWSVGAMPLFGIKLSIITTVLPVVLIAVGNSYGLHVIVHYIDGTGKELAALNDAEHREFVRGLIQSIIRPVFLAALTTLVSFLSFCFTEVTPIREFGYFAAFGVLVSFVIAVTLTPAILILRGPKPLRTLKIKKTGDGLDNPLHHRIADIFMNMALRKRAVVVVTVILAVVSLFGAARVVIDNIFVEYFRPDTDIVKSDRFIREKFGGSKTLSVVVEADSPEILLRPDTLRALDGLNGYLQNTVAGTGKVTGFTDLIKRINQVFNVNEPPEGLRPAAAASTGAEEIGFGFEDDFGFGDFSDTGENSMAAGAVSETAYSPDAPPANLYALTALLSQAVSGSRDATAADLVWQFKRLTNYEGASYYEIPADPARYGKSTPEELQRLVSNYLVLLSGNISEYANDPLEPTAICSLVQLRVVGQRDTDQVVAAIRHYAAANFPRDVRLTIGGPALVEKSTNDLVVRSVWTSMAIALVSLFFIVAFVNRSFLAGVIGVVPLLILILANFAVMGFLNIKLNIGTAMIFSLTMGIGIDYTIHFLEAYKRGFRESGGQGEFLRQAYITSGVAIILDAGSTGAGFAVLLLSRFTMLAQFGTLVALSLFMSALVGLVLVPALLMLLKPRFIENR
ncbi:MAG: MMPL family transporter [Treponema sp.]|jgi:predicted RND superfamily exporter protein|nr:MMPL family transporter [Treponema sp.]